MNPETLGFVTFAFAIGAAVFAGVKLLTRERREPLDRVADPDEPPRSGMQRFAAAVGAAVPIAAAGKAELQRDLAAAGRHQEHALPEFQFGRLVMVALPLVVAEFAALVLEPPALYWALGLGVAAAGLGWVLPRLRLRAEAKRRREEVERGLPLALDMMSVNLGGGANPMHAFERTAEDLRLANVPLADDMAATARRARVGSFAGAVKTWADRSESPGVRNLAMVLGQSEQLGANSAAALAELADHCRKDAKFRDEARANRLSFLMLFPTISCLWTSVAILLVGPLLLRIREERARSKDGLQSLPAEVARESRTL